MYLLDSSNKYCKYTHTSVVNCNTNPPSWGPVVSTKEFTPCAVCPVSEEQPWTVETDSQGNCYAEKIECIGPCDPACCPDPPTEAKPNISIPVSCCTLCLFQVNAVFNCTKEGGPSWEIGDVVVVGCVTQDDINELPFAPGVWWKQDQSGVIQDFDCAASMYLVGDACASTSDCDTGSITSVVLPNTDPQINCCNSCVYTWTAAVDCQSGAWEVEPTPTVECLTPEEMVDLIGGLDEWVYASLPGGEAIDSCAAEYRTLGGACDTSLSDPCPATAPPAPGTPTLPIGDGCCKFCVGEFTSTYDCQLAAWSDVVGTSLGCLTIGEIEALELNTWSVVGCVATQFRVIPGALESGSSCQSIAGSDPQFTPEGWCADEVDVYAAQEVAKPASPPDDCCPLCLVTYQAVFDCASDAFDISELSAVCLTQADIDGLGVALDTWLDVEGEACRKVYLKVTGACEILVEGGTPECPSRDSADEPAPPSGLTPEQYAECCDTRCVRQYYNDYNCLLQQWAGPALSGVECVDAATRTTRFADGTYNSSWEVDPLDPCRYVIHVVGDPCVTTQECVDQAVTSPPSTGLPSKPADCCRRCLFEWTAVYDCLSDTWNAPQLHSKDCIDEDQLAILALDSWVIDPETPCTATLYNTVPNLYCGQLSDCQEEAYTPSAPEFGPGELEVCCPPQCYRLWNITYDPASEVWGTATIAASDCLSFNSDCPPSEAGIDPLDFPPNTWRHKEECVFEMWECGGDCESSADCNISPTMPDPSELPPECECNAAMDDYTCTGSGDTCASPTKQPDFTSYTCTGSGDTCENPTKQQAYTDVTCTTFNNDCSNLLQQGAYTDVTCTTFNNNCGNLLQQGDYNAASASGPGIGTFTINSVLETTDRIYYEVAMLGCALTGVNIRINYFAINADGDGPTGDALSSNSSRGTFSAHFYSSPQSVVFSSSVKRWVSNVEVSYSPSPLGPIQIKGKAWKAPAL